MRGQKSVEDARKRAYDPRIHPVSQKVLRRLMDCTATRACPSCAVLCAASRVNPTCGVKPGNDDVCASIPLRQPESQEHDRKARELRQARHFAEREETDEKRESRHQRR